MSIYDVYGKLKQERPVWAGKRNLVELPLVCEQGRQHPVKVDLLHSVWYGDFFTFISASL